MKPFCQGTSQIGGVGGVGRAENSIRLEQATLALADLTPHTFRRASWKAVQKLPGLALPCPALPSISPLPCSSIPSHPFLLSFLGLRPLTMLLASFAGQGLIPRGWYHKGEGKTERLASTIGLLETPTQLGLLVLPNRKSLL